MPQVRNFALNKEIIPERIYKAEKHLVVSTGIEIEFSVQEELRRFLREYLLFIGAPEPTYLRIDAFPRGDCIDIIEVNVELREGWGVGLNLARAAGLPVTVPAGVRLPERFICYSDAYREEFELAQGEFLLLGQNVHITAWRPEICQRASELALDDKLHLARFAKVWRSALVRIPSMYVYPDVQYDEVPEHVVFKFRQKMGRLADTAGYSVITRSDPRFRKRIRTWYTDGDMIAQHRVAQMLLEDDSPVQCIIMCAGTEPVTGYLQVAPPDTFVINDKSARKGPLVFL